MQDATTQPDRFKPEMPQIPGVNDGGAGRGAQSAKILKRSLIAAVALVAIGLVGRRVLHVSPDKTNQQTSTASVADVPLPALATDTVTSPAAKQGPQPIATLSELAKPWSSKDFSFVNPATQAEVAATIIRLPGSDGARSSAYWAFALNTPFEACGLEYVTDLSKLASQSSYHATHPMVLAACDGTIFDPLRMATAPTGAWVRGEIVQGVGIRPPLAVEIKVQGNSIFASSME